MSERTRFLDAVEQRVLGALLEKEQTTPAYYPMTVNALVAACNQRNNREPVTELTIGEVEAALDRLRVDVLAWRGEGARSERWAHCLDRRWQLDAPAKAVMTLLLLRGAQTPGELRTRGDRLHSFGSVGEVEETLQRLGSGEEPLVVELPRRPGQREARWAHRMGSEDPLAGAGSEDELAVAFATGLTVAEAAASRKPRAADLSVRVDALEQQLAALAAELEELRRKLVAEER